MNYFIGYICDNGYHSFNEMSYEEVAANLEEFQKSDLYVRATCFSLMQIGEQLTHLHKIIGNDYPNIPWNEAIKLRTLIVHIYNKVIASRIYDVAKKDLEPLRTEILKIKIE